jgi:hypothetical protein
LHRHTFGGYASVLLGLIGHAAINVAAQIYIIKIFYNIGSVRPEPDSSAAGSQQMVQHIELF